MYDLFNAKARTKELPLAQWLSLLESANLMGGNMYVLAGTGGESGAGGEPGAGGGQTLSHYPLPLLPLAKP